MKMGKIYSFIIILFLSIMLIPSIFAIPGFPHEFYGDVLINNSPAPDGTLISAQITGKTVVTNSQNPVETENGSFGIDSLPLLVQGEDLEGSTIKFFVNGVDSGETRTFTYGGGPTEVNLSVTITTIIPPNNGGSTGGSSSGGSSSSGSGDVTNTEEPSTPSQTSDENIDETIYASTSTEIMSSEDIRSILNESNLTTEEIEEYVNQALEDNLQIERNLSVKKITSQAGESFISTFTIIIKNTTNEILNNIKIVEVIPKEIAIDASLISSPQSFRILVNDPVIEFLTSSLLPNQTISFEYSLQKEVKEDDFLNMSKTLTKVNFSQEDIIPVVQNENNPKDNFIENTTSISNSSSNLIYWILGIFLILIIVGIVYLKRSKKKKL